MKPLGASHIFNVNTFGASTQTDDELLLQVRLGFREAYRFLINRYEKKVRSLGFSFFHNKDAAADFAQDVFLKAFRALPSFEGRSSFSTWLFRIAYNHAVNGKNGRHDYASLSDEEIIAAPLELSSDSPEKELLKKGIIESVRTAVRELPAKYRICIDLSFFYDMKYEEISRIIAAPVNTVKSHILRAKKILRERLSALRG